MRGAEVPQEVQQCCWKQHVLVLHRPSRGLFLLFAEFTYGLLTSFYKFVNTIKKNYIQKYQNKQPHQKIRSLNCTVKISLRSSANPFCFIAKMLQRSHIIHRWKPSSVCLYYTQSKSKRVWSKTRGSWRSWQVLNSFPVWGMTHTCRNRQSVHVSEFG